MRQLLTPLFCLIFAALCCLSSAQAETNAKKTAQKTTQKQKVGQSTAKTRALNNKALKPVARTKAALRQVARKRNRTTSRTQIAVARSAKAQRTRQDARFTRVAALPSNVFEEPALYSSAALVVNEQSGERIYEKNARILTPIASITKLMTAMVVLDLQLALDEPITISEEDIDTLKHTRSRLAVGTTLSRGEMMLLALMSSENRAAHALARTTPGGIAAFIPRMNQKAQAIGMNNSRFEDPTGLSSRNVATANDLIRLVQAAHGYAEIRQYSTHDSYSIVSSGNGRELLFRNTNPLVNNQAWQIGVSKTGYISEAGKCLVMQAVINDTSVVIVLLDSAGSLTRVGDANRIKRWLETSPVAKLRAG